MKNFKIYILVFITGFVIEINAQVSFTLSSSLCAGNTTTVVMNTGSLSALAYSWAASPGGPVFSAPSSASTTITFPSAGTFTVGAGILSGSGYSYATNTIVINPSPTLVISSSSSSVCAGQSVTLAASGSTSYTWSPAISLNTTSGASVIATPSTATLYNVTGVLGSCTATVSQPILVNPNPSPGSITIQSTGGVCAGFTASLIASGANSYTWTGTTFTNSILQQSIAVPPGNYTVVGSSVGGCTSTATSSVALLPNFTLSPTAASATTCIESNAPIFSKPVHLTVSGANNYVWFPYNPNQPATGPQIDVRPATTTCYTVVGTTAVCSGTGVVCVAVIPQFSVNVNPANPNVCLSQSITLSVVNIGAPAVGPPSAFTYNWTEALNAPPISISNYFTPTVSVYPQNSTTYTVEVKDAIGCISFPELVAVSVLTCTSIDKISTNESNFTVYPNPAREKIVIKSAIQSVVNIEMINIIGETVLQEKRNFSSDNSAQNFSINDFPSGVYFIRINPEFGTQRIIKIIKQ